jgi:hypothetical protein
MIRAVVLVLVMAVGGCAEWSAGLEAAARYKAASNDAQARIWEAGACDLSLGGLDQLGPDIKAALIEHCLGMRIEQPARLVAPE